VDKKSIADGSSAIKKMCQHGFISMSIENEFFQFRQLNPDRADGLFNIYLIIKAESKFRSMELDSKKKSKRGNEPARVPLAAARLRPFFFKMKLEPMKTLDDTANTRPISLSDTIVSFAILVCSKQGVKSNRGPKRSPESYPKRQLIVW
jgi:hypothetical protein